MATTIIITLPLMMGDNNNKNVKLTMKMGYEI